MPKKVTTYDILKKNLMVLQSITSEPLTFYHPIRKKEIKPTGSVEYSVDKIGIYATTEFNKHLKITKYILSSSAARCLSDQIFETCFESITEYENVQAAGQLKESINKSIVQYIANPSSGISGLTKYLCENLPANVATALYVKLQNIIENHTHLPAQLAITVPMLLLIGASAGSNETSLLDAEEELIIDPRALTREHGVIEQERWKSPADLMMTTVLRQQYNITVLLLSQFPETMVADFAASPTHHSNEYPSRKPLLIRLLNAKFLLINKASRDLSMFVLLVAYRLNSLARCTTLPPELWHHIVLLALLQTTRQIMCMSNSVSTLLKFLTSLKNGSCTSQETIDDETADNIEHFIKVAATDIALCI